MLSTQGLLVALIVGGGGISPSPRVADARLDGIWSVVAAEQDGKPTEELTGSLLQFFDGSITFVLKVDAVEQYNYRVGLGAAARAIDLCREGAIDLRGLYDFDDGRLRIGFALRGIRDRPDQLPPPRGPDWLLLVLERHSF